MKDKYFELKLKTIDSTVIILKAGNFYHAYDKDAEILSYLFSYKVTNNKIGFPITSIGKVIVVLKEENINYCIYNSEEEIIKEEFKVNNYQNIINKYKKQEYNDNLKELLFERIEYLLDIDKDNYDRIRRFIDEF